MRLHLEMGNSEDLQTESRMHFTNSFETMSKTLVASKSDAIKFLLVIQLQQRKKQYILEDFENA